MTTRPLDRERRDRYTLELLCRDGGQPPLTAFLALAVNVTDANDHTPVFSQTTYTASVLENSYVGASIVQVNATDGDVGDNAAVTYWLMTSSSVGGAAEGVDGQLEIDHVTGVVAARTALDHERTKQIRYNVLAVDGGTPPKTGRLPRFVGANSSPSKFLHLPVFIYIYSIGF